MDDLDKQVEDLFGVLDKLPEKVAKKAARKALTKGARIVARDLKNRISNTDTGNLKESVSYKVGVNKNSAYAVVGISNVKKKDPEAKDMPTRYWHLTPEAKQKVEASLESTQNQVSEVMLTELVNEILKVEKK